MAEGLDDDGSRTAYWGTCENEDCLACVVVYPHWDRGSDLEDENDWENGGIFAQCYVCGSGVDWGGSDPAKDIIVNY